MRLLCQPLLFFLVLLFLAGCTTKDYRTASRASAGVAPSPATSREAVLQIYGAPPWGWRGWFAIHTWIAAKPANAEFYSAGSFSPASACGPSDTACGAPASAGGAPDIGSVNPPSPEAN